MKQCSNTLNLITSNDSGGHNGHIRTGTAMPLNKCINHIAKASGISNPINGHMARTLDSMLNKIPKELFESTLTDYAAVLKSNLTIFPIDRNMLIDSEHWSTFPKNSSATGGEATFEHQVFLLYNHEEQLFEPICVICPDESEKFRFHSEEVARIWKDIGSFIDQRNREKMAIAEPKTNSDTGDNDGGIDDSSASPILTDLTGFCPIADFSFVDHDFSAEASDALKNNLQIIIQLIDEMAPRMNHIQLQTKKIEAVLDELNQSSAERKIEMVIYLLKSVMEGFCIAAILDPEAGGILLKQTEVEEYLTKLDNTEKNETANTMSTKRKISNDAATSSAKRSSTVTASARSSSVPIKKYPAPKILKEPYRYQRTRMFSELAQGGSPLIQAGDKNSSHPNYMEIEVPAEDGVQLYAAVRAVTVEKIRHPCKSVSSKNPTIDLSLVEKDGERNCLKLPKSQYDPESQYAYFPITDDERGLRKKEILAHLFKFKQCGSGNRARTINDNLHMCYLEFIFCIPNGSEGYEFVSEASYSSIIEDGDGLVLVTPRADEKKELCERGGQNIVLPLSVTCQKHGISVHFDGKLQSNGVFCIKGKILQIKSPGRTATDAQLHLKVVRHEYNELIGAISCRTLYQDTFDFIPHNDLTKHGCVKQTINSNDNNVE